MITIKIRMYVQEELPDKFYVLYIDLWVLNFCWSDIYCNLVYVYEKNGAKHTIQKTHQLTFLLHIICFNKGFYFMANMIIYS